MQSETRPLFAVEIERVYKSFENSINLLRGCKPIKKTDISFEQVVISAYVKAYDFVLYMCKLSDCKDAFFQMPMLRGICEDLIAITYLLQQTTQKQNSIVVTKRLEELKRSSKAQSIFFKKYNPGQIVIPNLYDKDINIAIDLYRKAGHTLEEAKLPSVYQMAVEANLKDLYDFIYHSTSKVVHFDIFTLLSMGWGKLNKEADTIEPNFSYQHDYRHYYAFIVFYSNYLFITQTNNFKKHLDLPDSLIQNVEELEAKHKDIDWPELITFQQMNQEEPSKVIRIVYRFMQSEKNKE